MVGVSIIGGTILAEISLLPFTAKYPHSPPSPCLNNLLPIFAFFFGLLLSSYPENHPETTTWSSSLYRVGTAILPPGADFWRFFTSIGAQLIILALIFSPPLQKPLSHPFLAWLGKISLPVYLLHGPLMRTVLAWLVFGLSVPPVTQSTDDEGDTFDIQPYIGLPGLPRTVVSIAIFLAVLLFAAHLWTVYVDRWCNGIMKWVDQRVLGEDVVLPVGSAEK
jgi:peptidoglycan/LPS O-acetylase OafA/YrhL